MAQEEEIEFVFSDQFTPPPAGHWNPFAPGNVFWRTWYFTNEPLAYYLDGNDTLIPALATSWELSEDGKEFTVHLRENVKFHDGSTFTSKDVLTTFYIGKLYHWSIWLYLEDPPKGLEALDNYTVVFRFKEPVSFEIIVRPMILMQLIYPYSQFGEYYERVMDLVEANATSEEFEALRSEVDEYRPERPIGTNAYMFEDISTSEMILKKFPDYWRGADKLLIDKLRWIRWTSGDHWVALTLTGMLDLAWPSLPLTSLETLEKAEWAKVMYIPQYEGPSIYINHRIYPLSVRELRVAMAYAINRTEVGIVAEGRSSIGQPIKYITGMIDAEKWLPKDFIEQYIDEYSYNPDKAKEILDSIGFIDRDGDGIRETPNGTKLEFDLVAPSTYTTWMLAIENIATQLAKVGIKVHPIGVERAGYPERWSREGMYELYTWWTGELWAFHPYSIYNALLGSTGFSRSYIPDLINVTGEVPWVGVIDASEYTDAIPKLSKEEAIENMKVLAYFWNHYMPCIQLYVFNRPFVFNVERFEWPTDPVWYSMYPTARFNMLLSLGLIKPKGVAPPTPMLGVWITSDVGNFTGADGKTYGPFAPGDYAILPKSDAENLIAQDKASQIPPEVEEELNALRSQVSMLNTGLIGAVVVIVILVGVTAFMARRRTH